MRHVRQTIPVLTSVALLLLLFYLHRNHGNHDNRQTTDGEFQDYRLGVLNETRIQLSRMLNDLKRDYAMLSCLVSPFLPRAVNKEAQGL